MKYMSLIFTDKTCLFMYYNYELLNITVIHKTKFSIVDDAGRLELEFLNYRFEGEPKFRNTHERNKLTILILIGWQTKSIYIKLK